MGYMHISNLYRAEAQDILLADELYALEKIHGTSAHIKWDGNAIHLFSGGVKHEQFALLLGGSLPSLEELSAAFIVAFPDITVTVYGEAYGGACKRMKDTYGDELRFVAFDVRIGNDVTNNGSLAGFQDVFSAADTCAYLRIPFVFWSRIKAEMSEIDAERDRPSTQAIRNGLAGPRISEGIVLRPIRETYDHRGNRISAKHKRAEFSETKTPREVDPAKREILVASEAIAEEWVTDMRLTHVLDALGNPSDIKDTGSVIKAMVEDVCREASGEISDSKDARKAIG